MATLVLCIYLPAFVPLHVIDVVTGGANAYQRTPQKHQPPPSRGNHIIAYSFTEPRMGRKPLEAWLDLDRHRTHSVGGEVTTMLVVVVGGWGKYPAQLTHCIN